MKTLDVQHEKDEKEIKQLKYEISGLYDILRLLDTDELEELLKRNLEEVRPYCPIGHKAEKILKRSISNRRMNDPNYVWWKE